MNCSRALKWLVVVLLPLTVGWKLLVYANDTSDPIVKAEDKVVRFLSSHQFKLVGIQKMTGELPVVYATAGTCNMFVAVTSSRGWHRDMIRDLTKPSDQNFIVFRGRVYSEQPMFLTITDFLWSKLLNQLGFPVYASPVLAVVATKDCDADRLPWRDLG